MDPLIGAGLIGAGAQLAGGFLGAKGQADTNKQNLQIAREQMKFQERMRDTSWQTAVKDMQLAGLNPALAYEKGGAATPSGSSATMDNVMAPIAAATSNAGQAAALFSGISLQQAQAKKTNAEADFVAARARAEIALQQAQMRQTGMNTARAIQDLRWNEDTWGMRSSDLFYSSRLKQLEAQFQHESLADRLKSVGLAPKLQQQELDLRGLSRNEAQAWSDFYGGAGGTLTPWLNTAADVMKVFAPIAKFFQKRPTTHVWKR